ncbi:type IV secretory system conjugative DNA transfer family protein [Pseudomonas corrugata]|uniref:type IV secretory system conjugative DNA transfer family protein n=1 Tax=Pseudomonas corrugata TaxID=47879 RepID=UPI0018E64A5E|nr:type IV secretory system conjugative DNA transfer family protein [Pseudomonas corrugata]MBI6621572.1 type IV secretory system conjugative DNA transfer family protein [Pseudomonas corrugata]MBI6694193.1 type IV secretory system conjugative DNA transfer family protein [Pseudomonas corrugata]
MSKEKKYAIIAVGIVLFVLAVITGQLIGGWYMLYKLRLNIGKLTPFTLMTYYMAYSDAPSLAKLLQKAMSLAFVPPVIALFIAVGPVFVKKKAIKNLHGNARFATVNEVTNAGMFYDEAKVHKWPPVILGKLNGKLIADYSQEYTTVVALPGAGKGVAFVIPNLLIYPHSIINFDPKTENFAITAGYRSQVLKQKVYLFSPDNLNQRSHCWNPLDYINPSPRTRLADIKNITQILIPTDAGENQSFFIAAQDALNGILLYLVETPEEERTLFRAYQINQSAIGIEKWIFKTVGLRDESPKPLSEECKALLLGYARESERKRSTTQGIMNTYLSVFGDAFVRAATSKSDFNFNNLRKEPMSIFVGVTPPNVSKYQRLLNLFFSQALTVNTMVLPDEGPKDENGNPILKFQCMPLLDEFAALGPIEIIRSSSGYTRAYNMRYSIIFQNKSQVFSDKLYGRAGGESLLDTFHTELVFATESVPDAEDYSKRLGDTTLEDVSKSTTFAKDTSTTRKTDYHRRPLMLPQEIQRMPYSDAIIFKKGGRIHPIKCKKIVWYEDEFFLARANLPTPEIPPMVFHD